tara:strand:- start:139 stop:612 length:474 start_codon:yes stop_codon:yes gene_type:complete
MLYKYLYLKIIRYYISNINNINDVINIFCIIERIKKRNNTDDIMEIFIECFDKYPLTEIELQKISLLHQEFNNNNNINGFVITVLWLSIIISIDESLKKEKIKKYNLNQEIEIEIENDIKNELKKHVKKNKNIEINPLINISFFGIKYGSLYMKHIY